MAHPEETTISKSNLFLSLPFEIRTHIFEETLGKRVVHYNDRDVKWSSSLNTWSQPVHGMKYPVTLDTALLFVCRQTSQECTKIIYRSNTFSFDSSYAFEAFLTHRTPEQTCLLGRLEFVIHYGQYDWVEVSRLGVGYEWDKCWSQTLSKLQGLYYLHLDLSCHFLSDVIESENFSSSGGWCTDGLSMDEWVFLWHALSNFQTSCLKTVIVDSTEGFHFYQGCKKTFVDNMKQGAEFVRRTLMSS